VPCHGAFTAMATAGSGLAAIKPADEWGALVLTRRGNPVWWYQPRQRERRLPASRASAKRKRWDVINFMRAQADAERAKLMSADRRTPGRQSSPRLRVSGGPCNSGDADAQRDSVRRAARAVRRWARSLPRLRELMPRQPSSNDAGARSSPCRLRGMQQAFDKLEQTLPHLSIAANLMRHD